MANQWFIKHGGKEHGPVTSATLKKLADEGKIGPTTAVRLGADGNWIAANRVQGLFAAGGAASSTPPPAAPSTPPRAQVAAPPVAPPPPPRVTPLPSARRAAQQAAQAEPNSMSAKVLGALGLIFGILALATCWLPILGGMLGWTGIVVGALGLLLGLLGFVLAALQKGSGLALGIAGTSSSAVGLVMTVILGVTFGLFSSAPPPQVAIAPPVIAPPPVEEPVAEAPAEPEPEPEPVWTDASQPLELGAVKAQIQSVKIEKMRLENTDPTSMKRQPLKDMLKIRVSIENRTTDTIIQFADWTGAASDLISQGVGALLGGDSGKAAQAISTAALLTDNKGNVYKQTPALLLSAAAALQIGKDNSIRPGLKTESELVFPPPLDSIEYLRLELPGVVFGSDEPLRFQIPRAMISGL